MNQKLIQYFYYGLLFLFFNLIVGSLYLIYEFYPKDGLYVQVTIPQWSVPHAFSIAIFSTLFIALYPRFKFQTLLAFFLADALQEISSTIAYYIPTTLNLLAGLHDAEIIGWFALILLVTRRYGFQWKRRKLLITFEAVIMVYYALEALTFNHILPQYLWQPLLTVPEFSIEIAFCILFYFSFYPRKRTIIDESLRDNPVPRKYLPSNLEDST